MKKLLRRIVNGTASLVLIFSMFETMLLSMIAPVTAHAFSGGDGSATYPYRINSCDDAQNIANDVTAHYVLMDTVYCSSPWTPISNFSGVLDGGNNAIYNVSINQPSNDHLGMFTSINGGTVKNLSIDNLYINGADVIGGLAATTTGGATIDNVHVNIGQIVDAGGFAGGLVGSMNGSTTITKSSAFATGSNSITTGTGLRSGGLVGDEDAGTITDSYANVKIIANGASGGVGGLVGFQYQDTTIDRSYSRGSIDGGDTVGGLVGMSYNLGGMPPAVISNSFTTTTITNTGTMHGGLAGLLYNGPTITNNFYDKTATGAANCDVNSNPSGCTAVNADGSDGSHFMTSGTGTLIEPYNTGWDFTNVWMSGGGYPFQRLGTSDSLASLPSPNPPAGLGGVANGSTSVDLSWTAPENNGSGDPTGYLVEYKLSSDSSWTTADSTPDTNFTVSGLQPDSDYDFRVSTVAPGGQTASDPVAVHTGALEHNITDCQQLQNMKYDTSGSFTLANDIDCVDTLNWNSGQGFEPIDNFTGSLNGNGHSINNLVINRTGQSYIGLFAELAGASISNLNFGSGTVVGDGDVGALAGTMAYSTINHVNSGVDVNGNYSVGGLFGAVDSTGSNTNILNVYTNGHVHYEDVESEIDYMGGVIGSASVSGYTLTLNNVHSQATVDATSGGGSWGTGGVIGEIVVNDDGIANLTSLNANGQVSASAGPVGGLIGDNYTTYQEWGTNPGVINLTRSKATLDTTGDSRVGGLIGMSNNTYGGSVNVTKSYSGSNVLAQSYGAGGIVGEVDDDSFGSSFNIDQDYVYGTTSGNTDNNAGDIGGLVGYADANGSLNISNSYNQGTVSGYDYVGGIIGEGDVNISNAYSRGAITGSIDEGVGSLAGFIWYGQVIDSFATGSVTAGAGGDGTVGGLVGKTNGGESLYVSGDYYAGNTTYQSVCLGGGDFGDCTNQSNDEGGYYYDKNNAPLSSWDFDNIWSERAIYNDYPALAAFDTQNTPLIHNCSQLQSIRDNVSGTYTLANDIDCSDTTGWNYGHGFQPIQGFTGELNGNGHTISNLYSHWTSDGNVAIFADIRGGSIHDLNIDAADVSGWNSVGALVGTIDGTNGGSIDNVQVTDSTIRGRYSVGGLVGVVDAQNSNTRSIVTNSSSAGTIAKRINSDNNDANIGGLIGRASVGNGGNLILTDDTSSASIVRGSWNNAVGGLIGNLVMYDHSNATIHDLSSSGNIDAYGSNQAGGLIGWAEVASGEEVHYDISNLSASGNLSGGRYNQGGLFGEFDVYNESYVSFRGLSATGDVDMSSFSDYAGGGLIGELYGEDGHASIRQSYATGDVYAPGASYLGGLIGATDGPITVINSYATGAVTGYGLLGGLIGSAGGFISNSYASGNITSSGGFDIGGLLGFIGSGLVKNSFSTGLVSGADGHTDVSGFVGGYYETASFQNNFYDRTTSNQPNCTQIDGFMINNNVGECQAVNTDGSDPGHFLSNNVPEDVWDFTNIWQANAEALPTLRALGDASAIGAPTNLQATGDKTSLHLSWDAPETTSPVLAYRVEIKSNTDTSWQTLPLVTDTSMDVDPSALFLSGTYEFRVTAITEATESAPTGTLTYNVGLNYSISTCEDLQNINNDLTGNYVLTQDIDCSDTVNWNDGYGFEPIGMHEGDFTGTFNGQGHKITGLFMDRSTIDDNKEAGLFYSMSGATLLGFSLVGGSITGNSAAGAIAAYAYATQVSSVYSNLPVTSLGGEDVGGLFGEYYTNSNLPEATIQLSVSTGDVTGNDYVGGLVGYSDDNTALINTFYRGNVTSSSWDAGGLIGYGDGKLDITNSYAAGTVTGYDGVGGLAGGMGQNNSTVTNSFSAETLNYDQGDYIGYIVGDFWGDFGSMFNNVYFDEVGNGMTASCTDAGNFDGCTAVNGEGSQPTYFFNNFVNPPLNAWDSGMVWQSLSDDYPVLQGFDYTQNLTAPAGLHDNGITSSRVFLQWNTSPGADHYQVQYKPSSADDSSWTDYNHPTDPTATSIVINGLTQATGYDFRVRSANSDDSVTSGWSSVYTVTTGDQAYVITNCDQLQDIQGDLSGSYTLANNIDCTETAAWNGGSGFWPIGYESWGTPFTGTLDGNGYSISNLTINRTGLDDDSSGIFFHTDGANIHNLVLDGGSISSRYSAGALVVNADSTLIDNVHSSVDITTNEPGEECTGGLVGCMWAPGWGQGHINNSFVTGNVTGYYDVGGLVGWIGWSQILRSYADTQVGGLESVGGLVGAAAGADIEDSYSNALVESGAGYVGGLVGDIWGSIVLRTYSSGAVSGDDQYVGGLIGHGGSFELDHSFTTSSVSGVDTDTTGGLIGETDDSAIINSYWDESNTTQNVCAGIVSTSDLGWCSAVNGDGNDFTHFMNSSSVAPLDNWNFDTTWIMHENALPTLAGAPILNDAITVDRALHSLTVHWSFDPNGSPLTGTTLQYRKHGDSTWIPIDVAADATSGEATGLEASTEYEFELQAQNIFGQSRMFGFVAYTTADNTTQTSIPTVVTTTSSSTPKSSAGGTTSTGESGKSDNTDDGIFLDYFDDYSHGHGQLLNLKVGDVIHFTVKRNGVVEQHTATVKEIGSNYVVLTIASTPFDVRVNVGEIKTVSIDGQPAIKIDLTNVNSDHASIVFSHISTNSLGYNGAVLSQPKVNNNGRLLGIILLVMAWVMLMISVRRHKHAISH